jgi:hypothetical protein
MGLNVRVTLKIHPDIPEGILEKVERDISESPCSRAWAPKVRRHGSDSIPASKIISVLSRIVGELRVVGGVGLSSSDRTASPMR